MVWFKKKRMGHDFQKYIFKEKKRKRTTTWLSGITLLRFSLEKCVHIHHVSVKKALACTQALSFLIKIVRYGGGEGLR